MSSLPKNSFENVPVSNAPAKYTRPVAIIAKPKY